MKWFPTIIPSAVYAGERLRTDKAWDSAEFSKTPTARIVSMAQLAGDSVFSPNHRYAQR